ncbi:MAG TPA: hypothetical protein VNB54_10675 [Alphaproteobacteria bacterium]|nr:hypothetical protein [Alphaproteobacteria bacterium]
MQNIRRYLTAVVVLGLSLTGTAQQASNPKLAAKPQASVQNVPVKLTQEQKFVMDTVRMAVALPEPDPQDRLRVLSAAADVVSPIDRKMAKNFWHEGARIESELVRLGETPAISMMSSGQVDCAAALSFVENLPVDAALRAEQSLIGSITSCPKQMLDPVSRKLDAALQKGVVAPRALMATMAAQGQESVWSQQHFEKMFGSLPDPKENAAEGENYAAMYAQMSPSVAKDIASKSGLQLLTWLGKVEDSPVRTLAVRITTEAMQQALGKEVYQKALQSDVVANAAVQNAGQAREIQRPEPENVSILSAMDNRGTDQTERLRGLPPSQRAREAAANGFAAGTGGDKRQAGKYFDLAFSAADEVWDSRTPEQNAAAVVQEISEAAAQVDSLNALSRAQKLRDSSAQAIAMLAVARVVASNGVTH